LTCLNRKERWGFIGLGEMGAPMASNLAKANIDLTVYDKRVNTVAELVTLGAKQAATAAEVVKNAGIVSIAVRDEKQVHDLFNNEYETLVRTASPGTLFIIHSTIGSQPCRDLAAAVGRYGCSLLDAPVSGMQMRAIDGTLTILAGGEERDIDRAWDGLAAMAEKIFRFPEVGLGQAAKLANNLVSLSTIMVLSEGLAMGIEEGLDEETLLEVFACSSADSWIARNWSYLRHEWKETHPLGPSGVADMVGKDLRLALDQAKSRAVSVPATDMAAKVVPEVVKGTPFTALAPSVQ
jgi:3-hydroxyisobutyrate dehydrogenase-like beta-hydroxyacid dehydrogenase